MNRFTLNFRNKKLQEEYEIKSFKFECQTFRKLNKFTIFCLLLILLNNILRNQWLFASFLATIIATLVIQKILLTKSILFFDISMTLLNIMITSILPICIHYEIQATESENPNQYHLGFFVASTSFSFLMGTRMYLKIACVFFPILLNYFMLTLTDDKYFSVGRLLLLCAGFCLSSVIYIGEKYRRELFLIEREKKQEETNLNDFYDIMVMRCSYDASLDSLILQYQNQQSRNNFKIFAQQQFKEFFRKSYLVKSNKKLDKIFYQESFQIDLENFIILMFKDPQKLSNFFEQKHLSASNDFKTQIINEYGFFEIKIYMTFKPFPQAIILFKTKNNLYSQNITQRILYQEIVFSQSLNTLKNLIQRDMKLITQKNMIKKFRSQYIQNDFTQMRNIIKSIQYYVLDEKQMSMNISCIDIKKLVYQVINSLDAFIKKFCINVQLEFRIPDQAHIQSDEEKLEHIIFNILENAIENSFCGQTVIIKIKQCEFKKGEETFFFYRIKIKDQGKFISKSMIDKLPLINQGQFPLSSQSNHNRLQLGLITSCLMLNYVGFSRRLRIKNKQDKTLKAFTKNVSFNISAKVEEDLQIYLFQKKNNLSYDLRNQIELI